MYPHERSLVKRLEGKPFVLIGVNSDTDRKALQSVLQSEHITWRSFWDVSAPGPIARAWKINGWPTVHLIDHKGVIRYLDIDPDKIDAAVDDLLKEVN